MTLMEKPFRFKQFTIQQDRCAMKVGTDGVLLGAWTSLKTQPNTILDIGAGTGVIALMLAQRSTAQTIDAVEIEPNAYEQCVENFEASDWSDRLFCYHSSFQEFYDEIEELYELIVTNPPFYSEKVSSGSTSRDLARQNQALPYIDLLLGVNTLLSKTGSFSTIIPYKEEPEFISIAARHHLFPKRMTRVKGTTSAPFKRSLLEFSKLETAPKISELIIETDRQKYTSDYIELTKDFYLKM